MPRNKDKSKATNELRLNLCFRASDPMEHAVYDMLQSPSLRNQRTKLIAKAVGALLYIDNNNEVQVYDIDRVVKTAVETYIAKAGGTVVMQPGGIVTDTIPDTPQEDQLSAMDDLLDMFGI